jgi:hypothetical protein
MTLPPFGQIASGPPAVIGAVGFGFTVTVAGVLVAVQPAALVTATL